jgi:membrane-associated phospholipid phosphatase
MTIAWPPALAGETPCAPRYWIERGLESVVKYQQNPLRAARNLAYVAVALDTASSRAGDRSVAAMAAQHAAGGAMLDHLHPYEVPGVHRALARFHVRALLASEADQELAAAAAAPGAEVARQLIERALHDGADGRWNPAQRPPDAPGRWRAAPPLNMYAPSEPLAGSWQTWAIQDPALLAVPAPPLYDSDQYWSEAKEVWVASLRLSAEQRALADYWHLDKGSVTPAGLWNRKVLALLQRASCAPGQDARVLAAANVAMHDALIAAWHVKYRYWTLRPVNAIRERYDPHFLPYLITPAFPAYVSGHATVSAAAAEVLSHYFPEHAHALRAMAQDAADSRLYGGIHFRSDNEEGLRLGRQVGRVVVQRIERDPDAQWLAPTARTAGR